jgi:hypothetical protein
VCRVDVVARRGRHFEAAVSQRFEQSFVRRSIRLLGLDLPVRVISRQDVDRLSVGVGELGGGFPEDLERTNYGLFTEDLQ